MTTGFKTVNGFVWPECDTDAAAVVHSQVVDVEVALRHCRYWDLVVQAGGNMGVWPRYLMGKFVEIYTFEPEPTNFKCLAQNCPDRRIHKYPMALGNTTKRVSMEYPEGRRNMGACCVTDGNEIGMLRLDDLRLEACDLIQLDIEGYEPLAMAGAIATVRRYRPVVMLEDKGLSMKYGYSQGWSEAWALQHDYVKAAHVNRDIIYIPKEYAK